MEVCVAGWGKAEFERVCEAEANQAIVLTRKHRALNFALGVLSDCRAIAAKGCARHRPVCPRCRNTVNEIDCHAIQRNEALLGPSLVGKHIRHSRPTLEIATESTV